jgi:carboxypeptidase family protein
MTLSAPILASEIEVTSDSIGAYRIPGLQAGTYSLRVAQPGFAVKVYEDLPVTVNRLLILDVVLADSPGRLPSGYR